MAGNFVNFGGIERGPEALNAYSEQLFWNFSFLQYYVSRRELCGPELEARGSRLGRLQAQLSRLEAQGERLKAYGWRLEAQS